MKRKNNIFALLMTQCFMLLNLSRLRVESAHASIYSKENEFSLSTEEIHRSGSIHAPMPCNIKKCISEVDTNGELYERELWNTV